MAGDIWVVIAVQDVSYGSIRFWTSSGSSDLFVGESFSFGNRFYDSENALFECCHIFAEPVEAALRRPRPRRTGQAC